MRVLVLLLLVACHPRFVIVQGPLVRVDNTTPAPAPSFSTTDNFPDWCHGSTCERDDDEVGRFRAATPDKKGADRK